MSPKIEKKIYSKEEIQFPSAEKRHSQMSRTESFLEKSSTPNQSSFQSSSKKKKKEVDS